MKNNKLHLTKNHTKSYEKNGILKKRWSRYTLFCILYHSPCIWVLCICTVRNKALVWCIWL